MARTKISSMTLILAIDILTDKDQEILQNIMNKNLKNP